MLELFLSLLFMTNPVEQAEPVEKYNMEIAMSTIQTITEEQTIEDVDQELIECLGSTKSDVELLSMLVFAESNLEPEKGQQLVTHVVYNRVKNGYWGDTVEQVIYSKSQFSGTKLSSWGYYTGSNLKNVLIALYDRKFNIVDEKTLSLLYFNSPEINSKKYAKRYDLDIVTVVGNHTFYAKGD